MVADVMRRMTKTLKAMATCWVVGSLFALIDIANHIMSVSNPPCRNHWEEVAFFTVVLVVAILGTVGKRLPAFLLLAPAIILFLYCGTEAILCGGGWFAGGPTFELMYRPVLGTVLGVGTIITVVVVKRKEKTRPNKASDATLEPAPQPHSHNASQNLACPPSCPHDLTFKNIKRP